MEPRETTPTKEDPDYDPNDKYLVSGKKFILDRQNIQTILLIKTKIEEINILLELQRLKINKEN